LIITINYSLIYLNLEKQTLMSTLLKLVQNILVLQTVVNDEVQALIDEITELRQENLELKQQLLNLAQATTNG
jgi:regulator of replication initiation timing